MEALPVIADNLVITAFCRALNQIACSPDPDPVSASTSVVVTVMYPRDISFVVVLLSTRNVISKRLSVSRKTGSHIMEDPSKVCSDPLSITKAAVAVVIMALCFTLARLH